MSTLAVVKRLALGLGGGDVLKGVVMVGQLTGGRGRQRRLLLAAGQVEERQRFALRSPSGAAGSVARLTPAPPPAGSVSRPAPPPSATAPRWAPAGPVCSAGTGPSPGGPPSAAGGPRP